MLEEREAFLRAIFDSPDDDTPRLVYADWLEEHGEEIVARAIRISIEGVRAEDAATRQRLHSLFLNLHYENEENFNQIEGVYRSFQNYPTDELVMWEIDESVLESDEAIRNFAVMFPYLYQVQRLGIRGTRIGGSGIFEVLFRAESLRNVRELGLCGAAITNSRRRIHGNFASDPSWAISFPSWQLNPDPPAAIEPLLDLSGLESLVADANTIRLQGLDICSNNFTDDVVELIATSAQLDNLTTLWCIRGNQFSEEGIEVLRDRFGVTVVK